MTRNTLRRVHAGAGATALLCIVLFFSATATVELLGDGAAIAAVKRAILYGLGVLVPAMAAVGASGRSLGGAAVSEVLRRKQRRMKWAALNGLLVLAPAAVLLDRMAAAGAFGSAFYLVQAVELVAGPTNIALLALNLRDGLRLARTPAAATIPRVPSVAGSAR